MNSHNLEEEKRGGKSGTGENHVTEALKGERIMVIKAEMEENSIN